MALKPDRKYTVGTDISTFMSTVTERGGIVVYSGNGGSGTAMDQSQSLVDPTNSVVSGTKPAGLLVNDMVNLDLTRQHINFHKDEVQLGGKVTVLQHGEVTTNVIDSAISPTAGDPAYYLPQSFTGANGTAVTNTLVLTTTAPTDGTGRGGATVISASGTSIIRDNAKLYRVGTFRSQKDADGYAKVEINMK